MLQILALLFGLCSWGILIISIIRRSKKMHSLSWVLCSVALYIPSLCQFLEFKADDYDSVIDCAVTYHALSACLLLGTTILTLVAIWVQRKDK